MFVVPFLLFVIAKGREYYVAPAYPMLYAAGSVRVEAWLESLRSPWASILRRLVWTALHRAPASSNNQSANRHLGLCWQREDYFCAAA